MSALAASPVLVPLATTAFTALASERPRLQHLISAVGATLLFVCALLLVYRATNGQATEAAFGDWPAPFGIAFHLDATGAILVLVTALMGAAALIFLASDADTGPRSPLLLPLLHGLLAGVGGAFSTADLFNLYVWFEVMLVCALGLFALGGRPDQLDGSYKYLVLNLFGTLLLLMAVAAVYGATGHLNYEALAAATTALPAPLTSLLLTGLVLAFLVKAGAFPLYAWLPASYHTLPAPVLALVAGLLTKVGVYAVLRSVGDVFAPTTGVLLEALGWVAAATMLFGVLGAAYHWDIRRILSFHIVSQIGYILLAVALAGQAGNAAALFYTVHHIIVKANLFLIAGMIWRLSGSYDLRRIGGLYRARPGLAVLFLVPALSLVGIPPLSGFWSKLLVLQEALVQGHYAWTFIALLVSVLTLYSMMKIWIEAFWKPHPDAGFALPANPVLAPAWGVTLVLAGITIAIGLAPQALLSYAQGAARVLGG